MPVCGGHGKGVEKPEGCGATIIWIKTAKHRKPHPVDPVLLSPDGDRMLVFPDGEIGYFHPVDPRMRGYVSHFSTCPKRRDFEAHSKGKQSASKTARRSAPKEPDNPGVPARRPTAGCGCVPTSAGRE